jgi:putative membrane protein
MSMVWGIAGLIGLGISLMIGIRLYKKYRKIT